MGRYARSVRAGFWCLCAEKRVFRECESIPRQPGAGWVCVCVCVCVNREPGHCAMAVFSGVCLWFVLENMVFERVECATHSSSTRLEGSDWVGFERKTVPATSHCPFTECLTPQGTLAHRSTGELHWNEMECVWNMVQPVGWRAAKEVQLSRYRSRAKCCIHCARVKWC